LGKWFKRTGKRDEIFLASKFGFIKGSKSYEVDSSGEYCKKACAESLRILGIDSIDLCKYSNLQYLTDVLLWAFASKPKFQDRMQSTLKSELLTTIIL
jgi:aryl-alcohol dehydrogenase-like predicted oxidoreductase